MFLPYVYSKFNILAGNFFEEVEKMTYVDGFVIPIQKKKTNAYKKMALWGKRMWMKQGALEYFECVGEDLKGMPGCGNFKKMAKLKPNETAFFSFIVYRNKEQRNTINKKIMKEMNKYHMPKDMPFDMKRMAVGGFKTLVEGHK
jgi:alkaline phosphatase